MSWWSARTMSFSAKSSKPDSKQGQLRIIESGLDPGDWVVTEGIQRAFPGAKVDPQRSELRVGRRRTRSDPEMNTSGERT